MQGYLKMLTHHAFSTALDAFTRDIKEENAESEGCVHSISYYEGEKLIDKNFMQEIAEKAKEAMTFLSKKIGVYCYMWIDEQAGQMRVSIKKDPNIEDAFRAKIIYEKDIMDLVDPIYTGKSIVNKNGKVRVFLINKEKMD